MIVIKKISSTTVCFAAACQLYVWGRNDQGQLGLGDESMGDVYSSERYPRLVRSIALEGNKVVDMALGDAQVVVLLESGALRQWGDRLWLEPHAVSLPAGSLSVCVCSW